jgi:ATP-dependent Clp protease ATP-binding subunit ClpC
MPQHQALPSRNGHAKHPPSAADALKELLGHTEPDVLAALERARAAAERTGRPFVATDLLTALLDTPAVRALLGERRADVARTRSRRDTENPIDLIGLLTRAREHQTRRRLSRADAACVLAACLDADPDALPADLRDLVTAPQLPRPTAAPVRGLRTYEPLGFGHDLTAQALADGTTCPLVGMTEPVEQLLSGVQVGRIALLIGAAGLGKTRLVEGTAWHVAHGTPSLVPPELRGWTVVKVSRLELLAGTQHRGRLEKRVARLFRHLRENPRVVVFFDELHTLLGTGDEAGAILANALKGEMAVAGLGLIGATTPEEFARHLRPDEALVSRLVPILLDPPDEAALPAILETGLAREAPAFAAAGLSARLEAYAAAVRITNEHRRLESQPRKALGLLIDAAGDKLYAVRVGRDGGRELTAADVARAFSRRSGIPLPDLDADPAGRAAHLGRALRERVRGQDEAVAAVADQLGLRANGWTDPRRPRGRFVLLGPSGAGKAHLAESLAAELRRGPGSVFTLDVSAFQGQAALAPLQGAPPGYVGHGITRTVHEHVAVRPYSVILLKGLDRADPAVADGLLDILDGQARDAAGREVDFADAVVCLTARTTGARITPDLPEDEVRARLRARGGAWTSALLDRIDRVLVLRPHDRASLGQVLDDAIAALKRKAARPLPTALDRKAVRRRIVARAESGPDAGSARRIETELNRWLREAAGPTPNHDAEE